MNYKSGVPSDEEFTVDDTETILDLIADDDIRALFQHAKTPKTIPELATECGLPRSTAYRKVKRLVSTELLVPVKDAGDENGNATAYQRAVSGVEINIDDETTIGRMDENGRE